MIFGGFTPVTTRALVNQVILMLTVMLDAINEVGSDGGVAVPKIAGVLRPLTTVACLA